MTPPLVVAHAGHWAGALSLLVPLVVVGGWLAWEALRNRRR